jgi:MFS family permease
MRAGSPGDRRCMTGMGTPDGRTEAPSGRRRTAPAGRPTLTRAIALEAFGELAPSQPLDVGHRAPAPQSPCGVAAGRPAARRTVPPAAHGPREGRRRSAPVVAGEGVATPRSRRAAAAARVETAGVVPGGGGPEQDHPARRRPAAVATPARPAARTARLSGGSRVSTESSRRARVAAQPAPRRSRPASRRRPAAAGHPGLALAVLAGGAALALLEARLPDASFPSLHAAFGGWPGARWATTLYLVGMGAVLPFGGWLRGRLGGERLHRASLTGLAAASVLGGLAWDSGSLLALRLVEGAAGGLVLCVSLSLALDRVADSPVRRRPATVGLAVALLLVPAAGPTLVALVPTEVDWRLPLLGVLPAALLLLQGSRMALSEREPVVEGHLDLAGAVTASLGLGAALVALGQAPSWGWASYGVVGLGCLAALSVALLAVIEMSVPEPLIDVGALVPASTLVPLLLLAVPAAALAAGFLDLPLLLQDGTHLGAGDAALGLLVAAALAAAAMAGAFALGDRLGTARVAAAGLLLAAVATYLLHGAAPSDTGRLMTASWLRSLGMGLALTPLLAAAAGALGTASADGSGGGAGLAATLLVPGAAGGALVGSAVTVPSWYPETWSAATVQGRLLLLHGDAGLPLMGGTFLDVVLVTAGLCAVGALLALRLPTGRRGQVDLVQGRHLSSSASLRDGCSR